LTQACPQGPPPALRRRNPRNSNEGARRDANRSSTGCHPNSRPTAPNSQPHPRNGTAAHAAHATLLTHYETWPDNLTCSFHGLIPSAPLQSLNKGLNVRAIKVPIGIHVACAVSRTRQTTTKEKLDKRDYVLRIDDSVAIQIGRT